MILLIPLLIIGVILAQRRSSKRIEQAILRAHGIRAKRRWWS